MRIAFLGRISALFLLAACSHQENSGATADQSSLYDSLRQTAAIKSYSAEKVTIARPESYNNNSKPAVPQGISQKEVTMPPIDPQASTPSSEDSAEKSRYWKMSKQQRQRYLDSLRRLRGVMAPLPSRNK